MRSPEPASPPDRPPEPSNNFVTKRGNWRWLLHGPAQIIVIVALGIAVFAPNLGRAPLLDWDEATYAQVAHEAIANGNYLEFSWNSAPYLKKPPLLFWAVAGSFKAFGESEFAARLPSILCAILTMLLLYASGCEAGSRISGLFAAVIPLSFYFFVARGGRECATDPPLVMFSTLALYATLQSRRGRRWLPIAGAAVGFAILSKGAAGVIPLIVISLAVAIIPEFTSFGWAGFGLIVISAVVIAGPWYVYEAIYNPLFWKSFVGHETIRRVVTHLEDETRPASFTVATFLKELYWLFPIAIPLVMLTARSIRGGIWRAIRKLHPTIRLWTLWMVVAFAAACAVQTRLPWYVLPALIPAALIAGSILGWAFQPDTRSVKLRLATGLATVILLLTQLPSRFEYLRLGLEQVRADSLPNFAMALKAQRAALVRGTGELYFAGVELPVLVYYSGLHCNFVQPEVAQPIGLGGENQAPTSMRRGDLVFVPVAGDPIFISNLDDEWGVTPPVLPIEQQD